MACLLAHEEFKDGIRRERVPFGQELAEPPRREWFDSDEVFAAVLRIYNDSVALFGTGPGWHYVGNKKVPRSACPGCGTPVGGYHHVGCDDEVCPLCRLQAGACDHYPR